MAERRKGKKKKEQERQDEDAKPTKAEYAIAKFLREKLPSKKTMLMGHKVEYFIASKAVDCLLDSTWATSSQGDVVFTTRDSVVEYMDMMLRHKFFHRAKKIVVTKDGRRKRPDEDESMNEEEIKKEVPRLRKKKDKKPLTASGDKEEDPKKEESTKKETNGAEKKKEKKKIKLDMHMEQLFLDGNEPYVWIYDPVPVRAWLIGTLLVIGAVLVCLFPLWPKTVRHYVYYLSLAAAGFLVLIIALAILRVVVFVLVWMVSLGKHHLWLLPNLTEDVGFFESFWPLYEYHYKGGGGFSSTETPPPSKEKKSSKSSDLESTGSDHDNKESKPSDESGSERNSQESGENSFEILDPSEDLRTDDSAGDKDLKEEGENTAR